MDVTAWPDRATDPYAESSRELEDTWTYEVLESPATDEGFRVTAASDTRTHLLHFSETYNLQSVFEVLDRRDGAWKTRTLHRSPTGGGPFLVRNWKPSRAFFVPHPDLTQSQLFARSNFTSGGRSTENWMVQRVEENGSYRFELEHEPTKTRAVFRWEAGEPWWSEARYYYRERLVVRARAGR